jgi:uncharacterized repeat protein (TIGR01451 family)
LEIEDTVVHFDTPDGRLGVEPSNCVCIYAPRFGAVRQVISPSNYHQIDRLVHLHRPLKAGDEKDVRPPLVNMLPEQPIAALTTDQIAQLEREDLQTTVSQNAKASEFAFGFQAHENFLLIRYGVFSQAEKARLAEWIDAATAWTTVQGVEIFVEGHQAQVETGDRRAQATYAVDTPDYSRLRVCKVASKFAAKPGDVVDFTIRFDNIGATPLGNVTIVDNLTTRLELVPKSDQSNLKSDFSVAPNQAGSLVLRWELVDPIPPGEGGIVRFQAKVR